MFVYLACVGGQAVTVSHASRPCAPSNNLSISVQHARRVLHKMCISRTAPSAAHAERTCGVGLSELTARWNKRMKQPSAPPMKRQKVGREGERDREGEGGGGRYKEGDNHPHKQKQVEAEAKAVTLPSHLQT